MNNHLEMVIKRLESAVAELECEFLYLVNDLNQQSPGEAEKWQALIGNLRLARYFLDAAAAQAHGQVALAAG